MHCILKMKIYNCLVNFLIEVHLKIKAYKRNLKDVLLRKQNSGNPSEWGDQYCVFFNIDGLRQSRVTYLNKINYNEQ